jgi:hypothetical protein
MTDRTHVVLCRCCGSALMGGQPQPAEPDLCPKCDKAWAKFADLQPASIKHVYATVLCHSAKEIAQRMGCPASTHTGGLSNATAKTGLGREDLRRIARWALLNGKAKRPAGFEDCNPNGWTPEYVKGAVKVTKTRPQKAPSTEASPAVAPAVEATPQPGTPDQTPPVEAESPAPSTTSWAEDGGNPQTPYTLTIDYEPLLKTFMVAELQSRLERASDQSRRAYGALGRLTLQSDKSEQDLLQAAYECGFVDGKCRVLEQMVGE